MQDCRHCNKSEVPFCEHPQNQYSESASKPPTNRCLIFHSQWTCWKQYLWTLTNLMNIQPELKNKLEGFKKSQSSHDLHGLGYIQTVVFSPYFFHGSSTVCWFQGRYITTRSVSFPRLHSKVNPTSLQVTCFNCGKLGHLAQVRHSHWEKRTRNACWPAIAHSFWWSSENLVSFATKIW